MIQRDSRPSLLQATLLPDRKKGGKTKFSRCLTTTARKLRHSAKLITRSSKWAHFNKVKDILREANGISAEAPIPVKNKKRSHQSMLQMDFKDSDEESEAYSVASEGKDGDDNDNNNNNNAYVFDDDTTSNEDE